jgi:uncharacterized protein
MNDRFHYDALVDDALRSVVRRVLTQVAEKGLPGSHHFYISFRSGDPGVVLPDYLRAKYPEEMTIVLQHQYWDLILGPNHFEVTVSFNKQQERIRVPFAALSAFVDPSVRFGLQFDRKDKAGEKAEAPAAPPAALPPAEKRPPLAAPATSEAKPEDGTEQAAEAKPEDAASKIVKLDSFRKKSLYAAPPLRQGRRASKPGAPGDTHARVPVPGDVSAR